MIKEKYISDLVDGQIAWTPTINLDRDEGIKQDRDKCRVELIDAEWLEDVGWVLTDGAKKYHDHNWRKGLRYSRILGAILRHTLAILRGEDIDPESGKLHTAHISCEVMFLHHFLKHRPELDDRPKK